VAGFGIGSVLTPLLSLRLGTELAVAAVSIPHVVATAVRFWRLRAHVDRRVLLGFGLASAAGGLAGALLQGVAGGRALAALFGVLLVFVGLGQLIGFARRMRFHGPAAWIAGALSGLLGGLVGNQGGIRSAALFGFDVPKEAFVATSTAVGVIVDGARVPVYLFRHGAALVPLWPLVLLATAGAVAGTFAGERLLHRVPEPVFRRVVAALLILLGAAMLFQAARKLSELS
jgi:uncharacterized protein